MRNNWLVGYKDHSQQIAAEDMRLWARKILELTPEQLATFARQVILYVNMHEEACKQLMMRRSDVLALESRLAKCNLALKETLAAGGALPPAPPAGPSAGGGD